MALNLYDKWGQFVIEKTTYYFFNKKSYLTKLFFSRHIFPWPIYWSLKVNSTRSSVTSWKRIATYLYCFAILYSQSIMSIHHKKDTKKKTFGRWCNSRTWENSPPEKATQACPWQCYSIPYDSLPMKKDTRGLTCASVPLLLCCPGCPHTVELEQPSGLSTGSSNYRYMQPCLLF